MVFPGRKFFFFLGGGGGVVSTDEGDTGSASLYWISAMRLIKNYFIGTSSCS